jgi:hypothetical protein
MTLDAWLPAGFALPDGMLARRPLEEGDGWQIWEVDGDGRALVVQPSLANRWVSDGLLEQGGALREFNFGNQVLHCLASGPGHQLTSLEHGISPQNKSEAIAFAVALRESRQACATASFHDAIYVERLSRLLPTYTLSPPVTDDLLLGTWLTGGVPVSTNTMRRLGPLVGWLGAHNLRQVIDAAGLPIPKQSPQAAPPAEDSDSAARPFELAGRPMLEAFFREHVIDIVENAERYRALGIDFPSAIVLHGPPGCGKTFAVERLVEHLGWPSFSIDASSVASPYIHETSRKVAGVFEEAMKSSPSVLMIDEMEAFLADREMGAGSSHHRVEEVAEFLRRIPEAVKNHVLVVAMTNRVDMIDPAILRRGRFDHVIEVGMASQQEVEALLNKLIGELPRHGDIDISALARKLSGRPLSDVAFVVREGARLAARSGKTAIDGASLEAALSATPARSREGEAKRGIGFVWNE